jgi:transcriptional regulator with XRE-family HTH domain
MKTKRDDALALMRKQVKESILKSYSTMEQFCFDTDINKATLSNFMHGKKDFQISTLVKIARALKKKITIRLD